MLVVLALAATLVGATLPRAEWTNIPVHAVAESAGGVVIVLLGVLLLLAPARPGGSPHRGLAPGLVAMGCLDLFHAATPPGETFVWLRATSTFLGGTLLTLAWLPAGERHLRLLTWSAASLAIAIGVASITLPDLAPRMLADRGFAPTAIGLNVLGAVGFFAAAAAVWLPRQGREQHTVLGTMCLLFGFGSILFPWSSLWDLRWWYWHGIRLGAGVLALVYVLGVYRRAHDDLEREVERRTTELRIAVRDLETFSYSVSHDLRAPLRVINGFSSMVLEQEGLATEGRAYVQRVLSASSRMSNIIEDLLNLARVSRQEVAPERVDLSTLARDVAAGLAARESQHGVELEVAEGLLVEGDPGLLRVLLENVLGNAWKFTSRTLSPRVEVGRTVRDHVETFYVRDNGAGFDPAYVGRLFTPFERLHAQEDFPGTGVGLATVRRIVERHGGRAWIEGAVGQGATVWFTLPGGGKVRRPAPGKWLDGNDAQPGR
ncbi:MAG: ATP-binding protein [Pseudomonadota bacterium]|nr:ATP-binding protein [Pseudomonadota bacterium]